MNVVIPMAGEGKRFSNTFNVPKPLIKIRNRFLFEYATSDLNFVDAQFIFLVLQDHIDRYNIAALLDEIFPKCVIISVKNKTEGALCTCLLAREYIDNKKELIIANCDQYVKWTSTDRILFNRFCKGKDGVVLTFESNNPKWSYSLTDESNKIIKVFEKTVMGKHANVGIYWYKKGSDFVEAADHMIAGNDRVNNEFYVAPTYNYLTHNNNYIYPVKYMYGLGDVESVCQFYTISKILEEQ